MPKVFRIVNGVKTEITDKNSITALQNSAGMTLDKIISVQDGTMVEYFAGSDLPVFTPENAGLSVADGVTGAAVSYTIIAGTKVSISPTTYASGSNTYTAVVTVPDGYSNSGETVSPQDTATGAAQQYLASFVGVDSITPTGNHTTSNLVQTAQSGVSGAIYSFSDLSATAKAGYEFTDGPTTSGDSLSGFFGTTNITVDRDIAGTTALSAVTGNIIYNVAAQVTNNVTPASYSGQAGATVAYSGTINANSGFTFSDDSTSITKSGSITIPSGGGNVEVDFTSDTVVVDCSSTSTTPTSYTFTTSGAQSLLPLTMNGSTYSTDNLPFNSFISLSGNSGASSVTLGLEANTGAARSFDLKITHTNTCVSTVPISQGAFVADSITLPANVTIDADAVTDQAVEITTGGDGTLTIQDNMLWLTISDVTATGFNFSATENTGEQRAATITGTKGSATDTMKVTQAAADDSFVCSFWSFSSSSPTNGIRYTTCAGTVTQNTVGTSFNKGANPICIRDGSTSVTFGSGTWTTGNTCTT